MFVSAVFVAYLSCKYLLLFLLLCFVIGGVSNFFSLLVMLVAYLCVVLLSIRGGCFFGFVH